MHLFSIDPHQSQYREPIAANRIHKAAQEVLKEPLKWSRADLQERINGCWGDAQAILRTLSELQGRTLMDGRTGEVITPAIVIEELGVLSKDLMALNVRIAALLLTPEGKKRWDSLDFRFDATPIRSGLANLGLTAAAMALTAQSVTRGFQADPRALHLVFG